MTVFSRFEMRPVGQGAFFRGQEYIRSDANPSRNCHTQIIRWIYDCGTDAAEAVINASIDDLAISWPTAVSTGDSIDLLVISHFDKDHISGLPLLLTRYTFQRVFMPQQPRLVRLAVGLWQLERVDVKTVIELLLFVADPVDYILSRAPSGGTTIVMVEPAVERPDPAADSDALPDGSEVPSLGTLADPSRTISDDQLSQVTGMAKSGLGAGQAGVNVRVVASGARLVWSGQWEFVPYVDKEAKRLLENMDPSDKDLLETKLKSLLIVARSLAGQAVVSKADSKRIKDGVKSLRDGIYTAMGAAASTKKVSAAQKNEISLMAYLGPVRYQLSKHHTMVVKGASAQYGNVDSVDMRGLKSAGCGVLLTGDADLKGQDRVDRLKLFMTKHRTTSIGVLQVPHHGSSNNSDNYAAAKLSAKFTAINANPHSRHGHPDSSVVATFRSAGASVALANARPFETVSIATPRSSLPRNWLWKIRHCPPW